MGILTEIFAAPLNRHGIKGDFLLDEPAPAAEQAQECLGAVVPGNVSQTTAYRPQQGVVGKRRKVDEAVGSWTIGINGAPRWVFEGEDSERPRAAESLATDVDIAAARASPEMRAFDGYDYPKGVVKLHGLEIHIENPRGSFREGVSPEGVPWRTELKAHYGFVQRVGRKTAPDAVDGDKADIFLGSHPEAELVFVVDQFKLDGSYDEPKAMIGWLTEADARAGYLANYQAGWKCGPVTALTMPQFRAWLQTGDHGPVSKYRPIRRD